MKRRIFKLLAACLVLVFISGTAAAQPGETGNTAVVNFRIEGMKENLYYNNAMAVEFSEKGTVRDVINSYNGKTDVPKITVINEKENSRITQIGSLKEKSIGSPFDDGWLIRVNGKIAGKAPDVTEIGSGDEIVIYYGDASLIQYPAVDLTRMITDGIVKLTSEDTTADDKGSTYIKINPVTKATVTWDGMKYTTDSKGEIIIDSTGAGVRHTIRIERYDASGLPTVLRPAPDYFVKYGFDDVLQDAWYFNAVIFVSDRGLLAGVSDTDFAPKTSMNRAMFVTVLGRMADAEVDQTETTGFPDVKSDGWSAGYIAWAVKNGVVYGNSDGTFGQYKNITREQIAVMFYRYAQFKGYNTALANSDLSAYTDFNKVSGYAETAMRWAVENGIITGSGGRLNPLGLATRAEAASMLQRFVTTFNS